MKKQVFNHPPSLKGYLTVFLSLSLTIFLSVFLGLINGTIQNLGKMKFECAVDIGMNSVLGEFHRELLEQYELLFVDISYGTGYGELAALEEHLREYMKKNMNTPNKENTVWNQLELREAVISESVMAADSEGMIMQRQACSYMRENGKEDLFGHLRENVAAAIDWNSRSSMELWDSVMNRISSIALPLELNEEGEWEEVLLNNPADKVFRASEKQLQSLYLIGGEGGTGVVITPDSYISHRDRNVGSESLRIEEDAESRYLFQTYLFEKCGFRYKAKPGALLDNQIEYIIFGEQSDRMNMNRTVQAIFNWKFMDSIHYYFNNSSKYEEAEEIAGALRAVRLKNEFLEPVTHSVLYTWAFLDGIDAVETILQGGRVPFIREPKEPAESIVGGRDEKGLDYRDYLWLLLSCTDIETISLRAMDIMEMDIRQTAYNQQFRMDWCLESYRVRAAAADRFGAEYEIDRTYGYY